MVLGLSQVIAHGTMKFLDPKVAAAFLAQQPQTTAKPASQTTAASTFIVDQTYTNAEINQHFDGQTSGRIRRGDQALVLIAEADDQRDAQGQLLFSGVGQSGDQSLTKAPNKTLANAQTQPLYVFVPAPHRRYQYLGQATKAAKPIAVSQPDRHGVDRQVWHFPLQFN